MADALQKILANIQRTRKSSHPWEREVPFPQPFYSFHNNSEWGITEHSSGLLLNNGTVDEFTILSWNIDFMLPAADARMKAALDHLHRITKSLDRPCIILLQELLETDLQLLQAQEWIQSSFNLTDLTPKYWESGYYGTCTMVDKRLPISSVFRVHYQATAMERDALFVDVVMSKDISLRVCNTHLESLVANPPKRPVQLRTASYHMHAADVEASVLGGDLNAIEAFDKTLHVENDLRDAYLTCGGVEDEEVGQTWGQMAATAQREQFGLSRMDKLLFCGALRVDRFKTFGFGVEVPDEQDRKLLQAQGLEKGWITDHLGVRGDFSLMKG